MPTEIISHDVRTAHSPNRRPRWRKKAQAMAASRKKERVIQAVAVGVPLKEAAREAGIGGDDDGVRHMIRQDPAFKEALGKAKEEGDRRRAIAAGLIDGELEEIASRVTGIVKGTGDEKLAVDGGIRLLKGRGVLVGEGVQVAVGVQVNELPKYIDLRQAELGKPFRELVEVNKE